MGIVDKIATGELVRMAHKKILFATPEIPFEPDSGNTLRDYQQVRLAERLGFRPLLIAVFQRKSALNPSQYDGAKVATAAASVRHFGRRLGSKVQFLYAKPRHPFSWWLDDDAYLKELLYIIQNERPSAVVVRSWFVHLIPRLKAASDAAVIVDCHDADHHLASELTKGALPWRKLGPYLTELGIAKAMRTYLPMADEIWCVSELDRKHIHAVLASNPPPVVVVPSGFEDNLDLPSWKCQIGEPGGKRVLMVAGFGYGPNRRGLEWFLNEVWPRLIVRFPDAQFDIVGGGLTRELSERVKYSEHVNYHGRVADLKPFYDSAAVSVVPLLEGGGTRLKIVEGWKIGVPMVTTPKGIEGLQYPKDAVMLADAPEEFTEAIAVLFENPDRAMHLSAAGGSHFNSHYCHSAIARTLSASILAQQ